MKHKKDSALHFYSDCITNNLHWNNDIIYIIQIVQNNLSWYSEYKN